MNDATDALLISILRRAAWQWVEAARFTWLGLSVFWAVMWARGSAEMADALDGALAWLNQSGARNERMDIEVVSAVQVLAQRMNQ